MKDRPAGCHCDFRTYMVGDGCAMCNPELWKYLLTATDDETGDGWDLFVKKESRARGSAEERKGGAS